MEGADSGAIRVNAARLLGRALEDPAVLNRLRAPHLTPVDLPGADLQAAYVLLDHLDRLGRLTHPDDATTAARSGAATANLRAVSDWTVDWRRERDWLRRDRLQQGKPSRSPDGVPTSAELLLDSAARLNIVWWFTLWEQGWPPAPGIRRDVDALTRDRAFTQLTAVGVRLCQRAGARTAEPAEIAEDVLDRLNRIDPTAISRFLSHHECKRSPRCTDPAVFEPIPSRGTIR